MEFSFLLVVLGSPEVAHVARMQGLGVRIDCAVISALRECQWHCRWIWATPLFELHRRLTPILLIDCAHSAQCAPYKHHYDECVERVTRQEEDEDFKGPKEDCVEECK